MGYGSPGGAAKFLDLLDTPETYTGQALKLAKVKGDETGLNLDLLLSFIDWYAGGAPTSYPWEFESEIPFTYDYALHFSPILKNATGQYYVYVIPCENIFYLYNLTTKQWHRLADPTVAKTGNNYRPLALSPDGTRLACLAANKSYLEIYDIEANTWTASPAAPWDIQGALVWTDDDTIWASRFGATLKFFKYVVSTTTWSQFTNSINPVVTIAKSMACDPDGTKLYLAGEGSTYYAVTTYIIASDTYGEMSPVSTYLGNQRHPFYAADRTRIWYTFEADWKIHYFDCEDETIHQNQMEANPQRNKPSNWGFAAYDLSACLFEARTSAPRIMSYFGSGSWLLATKVLTDYNLTVFKKPNDGFAIMAVCKASNYFVPIPLFSTLTLPAGTWEFFYPKDGDYTKLKISGSVLK